MARITIGTSGSQGDVQPFVALGLGLVSRGHSVRIATYDAFEGFVRSFGLDFAPVEGDPQAMLAQEQGQTWLESGRRGGGFARGFRDIVGPALSQGTADALAAGADADLILFAGPTFYTFYNVAEKLRKPFIQSYLQPINPTRAFPSAVFPSRLGGHGLTNYLTHTIGGQAFWQLMRPVVNDIRRTQLGLPSLSFFGPFLDMLRRRLPVIYGYSPTVLPKPVDWNDALHVTGHWFLPEQAWTPPPELVRFLAGGPAPVYVGFGSMVSRDAERLTAVVLDALQQAGQPGIILSGWAGLGERNLPPSVLGLERVPHRWLFPQVAAVVHHGGVGTTHEGLRAGRPSILVPFFGDQPFWADRVAALGAAPDPIPQAELTAGRLAGAIRQAVSDQTIARRAAEIGRAIRAEDGIGTAVDVIEAFLAQRPGFDWRGM
jgi:UDP:flavonoid glycosyltransferase YjiC (YdhE family)